MSSLVNSIEYKKLMKTLKAIVSKNRVIFKKDNEKFIYSSII